ncbi:hypothetical protein EsH8_I_001550 [Colletotrichum jinshuiense]
MLTHTHAQTDNHRKLVTMAKMVNKKTVHADSKEDNLEEGYVLIKKDNNKERAAFLSALQRQHQDNLITFEKILAAEKAKVDALETVCSAQLSQITALMSEITALNTDILHLKREQGASKGNKEDHVAKSQ